MIWDPANAFVSGEEDFYPNGYEDGQALYWSSFTLKMPWSKIGPGGLTRWERIGAGQVAYLDQLRALQHAKFSGGVSIETHWTPPGGDPITNTRRTYAGLLEILAQV